MKATDILEDIYKLDPNWDGYGGANIEKPCYENVKSFLKSVKDYPDPDVVPNPNGTVSLFWENDHGEEIDLEIGNTFYQHVKTYSEGNDFTIHGNSQETVVYILQSLKTFFRKESEDEE